MKHPRCLLTLSLLLLATALLGAQQPAQEQKPAPPADPAAEQRQALMAIESTLDRAQRAKLIEEFLQKYPDTPYAWSLCLHASDSFRRINNHAKAVEYGERAIALKGDDPMAHMIVADALAEGAKKEDTDYAEKLLKAEKYAQRSLELLPSYLTALRPPPTMTQEEIELQKKLIEAQPHATLGYIYLLRENNPKAEEELLRAVQLAELQPNQADLIRLGRAYLLQGKHEQAVEMFRKAVGLGGPMYEQAVEHLKLAEQELAKRKPAAPTPPESQPPAPKPPQPEI